MGSRISRNDIDGPGLNSHSPSSTNDQNISLNNSKSSDQSTQPHVYIKDQFRLEFLDCNCCCDTTKKVVNCDFQGNNLLQDLYEMVITPEYKLNCRCLCGDKNGDPQQSIKFGLTGSPNVHLTDFSCPISSDSKIKQ